MCASVLLPLPCALQPFQQCATRHAPARPHSLSLSMSDQVPSSVPDLMGIVSSMTEENQAALTAMLAAIRERTASKSLSPLPEAALPTDESSTLPPEGASTQDLPEPCTEEPPLVPLFDPARAENFLYQPCSKNEKPWADQLAPELPPEAPADSAPAPVPSQDALPANPEIATTEAPKPRPSPSSPHWPNAPDLPDDALPAKQEVIPKAAPKPRRATETSARAPAQGSPEPARLATGPLSLHPGSTNPSLSYSTWALHRTRLCMCGTAAGG